MYFAKITNNYAANNQLKAFVGKQLKSLECNTVEDPEAFKKHLERIVHRANLGFKRCKPLVSYMHQRYTEGHYSAGVSEVIEFSLYKHQGVFNAGQPGQSTQSVEGVQATMFD